MMTNKQNPKRFDVPGNGRLRRAKPKAGNQVEKEFVRLHQELADLRLERIEANAKIHTLKNLLDAAMTTAAKARNEALVGQGIATAFSLASQLLNSTPAVEAPDTSGTVEWRNLCKAAAMEIKKPANE